MSTWDKLKIQGQSVMFCQADSFFLKMTKSIAIIVLCWLAFSKKKEENPKGAGRLSYIKSYNFL